MKKLLLIISIVTLNVLAQAQTFKTFSWDNQTREYLEILPSDMTTAKPVCFVLHGIGDSDTNMASVIPPANLRPDWYYIVQQALIWNVTVPILGTMNMGATWNVGATAAITYIIPIQVAVNPDVDDSGFLIALLDSVISNYNIDEDSVFFFGFSLGGFMTNRMAKEHSDRITAIASVSGTIGNNVTATVPPANINALHIHGTSDVTVGYATATISIEGINSSSLGLGAEATVEYWRNFNNCDAVPIIYDYPNIKSDGLTFERYHYLNGDNGSRTAFIKVNGGLHSWYYTPQNDIDYFDEIIKFFRNDWESEPSSVKENFANQFSIYPNPATTNINIKIENSNQKLEIYNVLGVKVFETQLNSTVNNIDISDLAKGVYFVKINNQTQNLIIQ
jgi:polyhydroxybutyrate depolymerase